MIKRTKPIKRTPLKQGKGRRAKEIDKKLAEIKAFYFGAFGGHVAPCQLCGQALTAKGCHAHHKLKRSLGGKHTADNIVILCPRCHGWIHDASDPGRLSYVRHSEANAKNTKRL